MYLDEDLILNVKDKKRDIFRIWEPENTIIVLGRSNDIDSEVVVERARIDNVKVGKRLGGGGAVVLTKGLLVITIAKLVDKYFNNQYYFDQINNLIIAALNNIGVSFLEKKGISDICIRNKKVLGSSIYRRNKSLFYQASLLVNPSISIISKYLKHPSREPDYREGRRHEDFITTLKKEGYFFTKKKVINSMERIFDGYLWTIN